MKIAQNAGAGRGPRRVDANASQGCVLSDAAGRHRSRCGHRGLAPAEHNLPSYELEVWWDGEERIRSYRVTIGMPQNQTPTGGYRITRIKWNPSWTSPSSPWARGKKKAPPSPNNPMGRVKLQFDDYLYVHGTAREDQLARAHSHGCVRISSEDGRVTPSCSGRSGARWCSCSRPRRSRPRRSARRPRWPSRRRGSRS